MKNNKKLIFSASAVVGIAFITTCFFALRCNLTVRTYTQTSDKLTAGIRLAVISDLHNCVYGENQQELIKTIDDQSPDVILLTGDIAVDAERNDGCKELLSAIGKKYPCFYVAGNHEFWTGKPETIKAMIRSYGVTVLEGSVETVEIKGQRIQIGGIDDPDKFFEPDLQYGDQPKGWNNELSQCESEVDNNLFSILLSHRPEATQKYAKSGFNLVLCGHAHGGQVRVPFLINGLYAPNQGLFPRYAGGQYHLSENTDMIVSRGLALSKLPRVFNPPEIVIVNVNSKD
jgi:predicted MPP superfamily phosphohydrolase